MNNDAFAPNEITENLTIGETRAMFALKAAHSFAVSDARGDMLGGAEGMFRNDTRVLSHWILELGEARPSLLSGTVSHDNVLFTADLTNEPLPPTGGKAAPAGVIHVQRRRLLWDNRLFEQIHLHNFDDSDLTVLVRLRFHADFRDIFEVRGMDRERRGEALPAKIEGDHVQLGYRGLDEVMRRTVISFSETPSHVAAQRADFELDIPRLGSSSLYIEVGDEHIRPSRERYRRAAAAAAPPCANAAIAGPASRATRACSTTGWTARARISRCWWPTCPPAPIPTPASPGFPPRLDATA